MKLTKSKLKQIIQEELEYILSEKWPWESTTEKWDEDPNVHKLDAPGQSLEKSRSYQKSQPKPKAAAPPPATKSTRTAPGEGVRQQQLRDLGLGFEE